MQSVAAVTNFVSSFVIGQSRMLVLRLHLLDWLMSVAPSHLQGLVQKPQLLYPVRTMSDAKELEALQVHSDKKIRPHNPWRRRFQFFANYAFIILTTIGVIIGFAIGFGVRKFDPSPMTLQWLGEYSVLY